MYYDLYYRILAFNLKNTLGRSIIAKRASSDDWICIDLQEDAMRANRRSRLDNFDHSKIFFDRKRRLATKLPRRFSHRNGSIVVSHCDFAIQGLLKLTKIRRMKR